MMNLYKVKDNCLSDFSKIRHKKNKTNKSITNDNNIRDFSLPLGNGENV